MACNMSSPTMIKKSKIPLAVIAAVSAILFFSWGDQPFVAWINTGTVPMGSMTAYSVMNAVMMRSTLIELI